MGFLFKNVRMLFISLVPNLLPLIFAAGLMGYLQVEMEAGIAIVFAIVFGIAVDDTIHFLSKYNLALRSGKTNEQALEITFRETGKAICLTSVILFFGFMIMLFSNNPPSVNIGVLISITLVSAVACDLFLLPILLRRFMK
jgi:predicted RND superfamily exporter protein